jgi:hypothetical protein
MMKSPKEVLTWAQRRYVNQRQRWLEGEGEWPLTLALDRPGEREALKQAKGIRDWTETWHKWRVPAGMRLIVEEVGFRRLGAQRLPTRVEWDTASSVAVFVGDAQGWGRAVERRQRLLVRWPVLGVAGYGPRFSTLAAETDVEFERMFALLQWFDANPRSGLYLRQLPVEGLDTKWIDRHRRRAVSDLLRRTHGAPELLVAAEVEESGEEEEGSNEQPEIADFYTLCGLLKPAPRVRLLVLCSVLRRKIGNLRDIEVPLDEVAALDLAPSRAIVIENLESGYSLPDLDGTVAFIRLGNSVSLLASIPWLTDVPVVYWGDIDTHGFAILSLARRSLRTVTSVLMDEVTVERYLDRRVAEPVQTRGAGVATLTEAERRVYDGLLSGRWGERVRIEQERIEWPAAMADLTKALDGLRVGAECEQIVRPLSSTGDVDANVDIFSR